MPQVLAPYCCWVLLGNEAKRDRGTAKAAGAWMPGDFPRSPGSCCHGPLETLGTWHQGLVSPRETNRAQTTSPTAQTSPQPGTASSRPRSGKRKEKTRRRTVFSWKGLSHSSWQNISLSSCTAFNRCIHTCSESSFPSSIPAWRLFIPNVICSRKHEGQRSAVLKNTSVPGFESWLSTS